MKGPSRPFCAFFRRVRTPVSVLLKKLSHRDLLIRQNTRPHRHLPFCAVVNNIRSLYNVGSIFRTAEGAGLEKIWLCGITGIPPDPKISKTALGAEKPVPWEYRKDARECLHALKERGYQLVLLEQTEQSIPYENFTPRPPVCLVIGNEIGGVEDVLLPACDHAVEIAMEGLKNSLNVTVAFGIVAYHFRHSLRLHSSLSPHQIS